MNLRLVFSILNWYYELNLNYYTLTGEIIMERKITFRRMEPSTVIEEFINAKLDKFEELLGSERSPVSVSVVIDTHPTHAHNKVDVLVDTPDYNLIANHEGQDVYVEIDTVMDKMLREIRRAKEKRDSEQKKSEWHRP